VQGFDIDGRSRRFRFGVIAEDACRPLKELVFPLLDRKRLADGVRPEVPRHKPWNFRPDAIS